MANKKVLHKRSNVAGKEPTTDQLDHGELAINFADEDEKIFIKNSENDIIAFIPKRAFIEAPIVDEADYLIGTKDNGIVKVDPSSLDTSAYIFDMSLITSSNANVGVQMGIQNTAGSFVNTAWNVQGNSGYSGTSASVKWTNSTTEHNYNVTLDRKDFDNNVFYVNVSNNYTGLTTANITTNMPLVNMAYCFNNCRNLTSIESKGICPANMTSTFNLCTNLTSLDGLANWNTDKVKDMTYVFNYCNNLTNIKPLVNWNTSNVTNMANTFYNCHNITSLDGLVNWNTSNVTNMASIFSNCHNITSLDGLVNWNVSGVGNMSRTFSYCYNITNLEALSNWNTSNVTNMSIIFCECNNLTNLDGIANWNVTKVTSMYQMLYNCYNAQTHGFNNWTGASANCANMFRYCNSLDDIQIHWNITCAANMFANRNTPLNVYASTSTNAYNQIYRAMGNSTYNSSWNVTLYELEE